MASAARFVRSVMTAAILSYSALTAHANKPAEVICYVDGTDDLFKVYPRQLVFESDRFAIYQLIDGLTLLVINKQTRRFNRLSNLNLLPESTLDPEMPPEPYQYFTGQCQ